MASALALLVCAPLALEAHGLADLARLESRLPLVAVAPPAAPDNDQDEGPVPAGDGIEPAGEGAEPPAEDAVADPAIEEEGADEGSVTLHARLLTGAALARLVEAALAEAAEGRTTIGLSGLFAETREGSLSRVWAAGAPTGPSMVHTVGVDARLFEGRWATFLVDPALPPPPYDPEFVPEELILPPTVLAPEALASRRAALEEAGWIPACPRAGPLS